MALTREQAERCGIDDEVLLVVFDGGIAHQCGQEIGAFPRIETGGFHFLFQKRAALLR